MELAEEIEEKDLQYQTVLNARKRTVAQLDISVEPADDTPMATAQADFVKSFLNRDTLESEIFDMLDAIGKGFSVTEIIWETSSSQWMPKSLNWVDPRWIAFQQNDLSKPLLKVEGGYKELAPFKYIYTTIKAKSGLDIRGGLIRGVFGSLRPPAPGRQIRQKCDGERQTQPVKGSSQPRRRCGCRRSPRHDD